MHSKKIEIRQIIRFLIVGCCNTLFSYLVYAFALYLGMTFVWANFCAVVFGVLVSFRMQKRFVFRVRSANAFLRFVSFWLFIWAINVGLIYLIKLIVIDPYLSGAFALIPITIISFFVQKFWVFKDV